MSADGGFSARAKPKTICSARRRSTSFAPNCCSIKKDFERAVEIIEKLRQRLAADEFRVGFLADKLVPYQKMHEIWLERQNLQQSFFWLERACAIAAKSARRRKTRRATNDVNSVLSIKLNDLHDELNWFYSRLERAATGDFTVDNQAADKIANQNQNARTSG